MQSMELTHEDVQKIVKILDEATHLDEVELVYGDLRLHVRRHGAASAAAPAPLPDASHERPAAAKRAGGAAQAAKSTAQARPVPAGMVAIKAPMLGTFYRAAAPGEPPFVEVGQQVGASDTVCLIEVMKLFNSIKAGVAGRIAEIRAANAALVEYDEVLIVIEPAKG